MGQLGVGNHFLSARSFTLAHYVHSENSLSVLIALSTFLSLDSYNEYCSLCFSVLPSVFPGQNVTLHDLRPRFHSE